MDAIFRGERGPAADMDEATLRVVFEELLQSIAIQGDHEDYTIVARHVRDAIREIRRRRAVEGQR